MYNSLLASDAVPSLHNFTGRISNFNRPWPDPDAARTALYAMPLCARRAAATDSVATTYAAALACRVSADAAVEGKCHLSLLAPPGEQA